MNTENTAWELIHKSTEETDAAGFAGFKRRGDAMKLAQKVSTNPKVRALTVREDARRYDADGCEIAEEWVAVSDTLLTPDGKRYTIEYGLKGHTRYGTAR